MYLKPGQFSVFPAGIAKKLPPYQQLVFIWVWHHKGNETNSSFPSIKKLCEETGISESSVQRTIRELEKKGLFVRNERFLINGRQTSNEYEIVLDYEEEKMQQTRAEGVTQTWGEGVTQTGGEGVTQTGGEGVTQIPPIIGITKTREELKNKYSKNIYSENSENEKTPKEKSEEFFQKKEKQEELIQFLVKEKNMPAGMAETRVTEFVQYWTERTQNGKKQKWEMEKTFELSKRLANWFKMGEKFEKNRSPQRHQAYSTPISQL